MRYCTSCGHEMAPGASFCISCGTRLTAHVGNSAVTNQTQAAARASGAALPLIEPAAPLVPAGPTPTATAAPPTNGTPQTKPFGSSLTDLGLPDGQKIDPKLAKALLMGVGGLIALALVVKLLGALFSGGLGSALLVVGLALVGVVGFFAHSAHREETREARTVASLPPSVGHVVAQMEPGAQAAFFKEYERFRKKTWLAYLLMWPLFGTHYFYLRKPLLNVLYWFTGAGAGLWGLIDIFRMRSLVREANEQSARQALQTLHTGAVFASMPAPPRAMTQPVPPMYGAHVPTPQGQPSSPTPQDR